MFAEIAAKALKHAGKVTLVVTGSEEHVVVAMIADPKSKDGVKLTPLALKGKPEEVDKALSEALEKIFVENEALFSNVDQVIKDAKEPPTTTGQKKEEPKAAAKRGRKPAEATEGAADTAGQTDKPEPPKKEVKLTNEQKKVKTKAKDSIEKAKKVDDPDLVTFYENQTLKAYTDANMPESELDEIKSDFAAIRNDKGVVAEDVQEKEPNEGLFSNTGTESASQDASDQEDQSNAGEEDAGGDEDEEEIF